MIRKELSFCIDDKFGVETTNQNEDPFKGKVEKSLTIEETVEDDEFSFGNNAMNMIEEDCDQNEGAEGGFGPSEYGAVDGWDPSDPLFLRNYAQFLESRGEFFKAEEYYDRAIMADPNNGEVLCLFAKLVWELYHDKEQALPYFNRAALAAPGDSDILGAYASFLWEMDEEEEGHWSDTQVDDQNGVSWNDMTKDFEEQKRPISPPLHLAMGLGLNMPSIIKDADVKTETTDVEEYYRRMLEKNSCNPLFLKDHTEFLNQVRGDPMSKRRSNLDDGRAQWTDFHCSQGKVMTVVGVATMRYDLFLYPNSLIRYEFRNLRGRTVEIRIVGCTLILHVGLYGFDEGEQLHVFKLIIIVVNPTPLIGLNGANGHRVACTLSSSRMLHVFIASTFYTFYLYGIHVNVDGTGKCMIGEPSGFHVQDEYLFKKSKFIVPYSSCGFLFRDGFVCEWRVIDMVYEFLCLLHMKRYEDVSCEKCMTCMSFFVLHELFLSPNDLWSYLSIDFISVLTRSKRRRNLIFLMCNKLFVILSSVIVYLLCGIVEEDVLTVIMRLASLAILVQVKMNPRKPRVTSKYFGKINFGVTNLLYLYVGDDLDLRTNPFQEGEDDVIMDEPCAEQATRESWGPMVLSKGLEDVGMLGNIIQGGSNETGAQACQALRAFQRENKQQHWRCSASQDFERRGSQYHRRCSASFLRRCSACPRMQAEEK